MFGTRRYRDSLLSRRFRPLTLALTAVLLIGCGGWPTEARARIWRVRLDRTGDVPTIQAALDSAAPGDEVLVAPGTYSWTSEDGDATAPTPSLLYMQPDLILRSEGGPEVTSLDAERRGRVVTCVDVRQVRIEGFTVRNGRSGASGAGIYVAGDSRATIANCIVRDNFVLEYGRGGGIYCENATLLDCRILSNICSICPGGGLYVNSSLVSRCVIEDNLAFLHDYQGGHGGGLVAVSSTVVDCRIEGNRGSVGAGVRLDRSSLTRCIVTNNEGAGPGGGVFAQQAAIRDCLIAGNGGRRGGGISGTGLDVIGCTVIGNSDQDASDGHVPAGGIEGDGRVYSSIVAFNTGAACGGNAIYSCCDFFGNSLGDAVRGVDAGGNFSADPEFCATDAAGSLNVTLQQDSPCAPGNHPDGAACGPIGEARVGCRLVTVRPASWTSVRLLYR